MRNNNFTDVVSVKGEPNAERMEYTLRGLGEED